VASAIANGSGELVGGCDIVTEMFETGELADTLGVQQPELEQAPPTSAPGQSPPLQIG
jgi:monothiol glutaredoxin